MSSSDNPVAFMMSAMLKPIDHKGIFFFFLFVHVCASQSRYTLLLRPFFVETVHSLFLCHFIFPISQEH